MKRPFDVTRQRNSGNPFAGLQILESIEDEFRESDLTVSHNCAKRLTDELIKYGYATRTWDDGYIYELTDDGKTAVKAEVNRWAGAVSRSHDIPWNSMKDVVSNHFNVEPEVVSTDKPDAHYPYAGDVYPSPPPFKDL